MRQGICLLALFFIGTGYSYGQVESAPGLGTQFATAQSESSSGLKGSVQNLSAGDLFTGSANIYVPLYEYEKGNINLGVGLFYNTKGVKVDEHSGNYGLHWGLTGGGTITKYVKDLDDDYNGAFKDKIMTGQNYFGYQQAVGILHQSGSTPGYYYKDKEYDEYHVTAGGYSFSFTLGKGGAVFVVPKHEVKVEQTGDDFLITDIHGNRYFFKKSVAVNYQRFLSYAHMRDADTGSVPLNTPPPPVFEAEIHFENNNQYWTLEKVTFANKEEVKFDYLNYSSKHYQLRYGSVIPGVSGNQHGFTLKTDGWDVPLLQNVYYPDGSRVKLEYNSTRCDAEDMPLLRKVEFYKNGHYVKKLDMHYSYLVTGVVLPGERRQYLDDNVDCNLPSLDPVFSDPLQTKYARMLYYRVQLDSIVSAYTGGSQRYYAFGYYNELHLPPRLSARKDYYGYHNGKNTQYPANLVPDAYSAYGGTLDKSADPVQMKAGSIKQVTNALGLSTRYTYKTTALPISGNWNHNIEMSNPDASISTKMTDSQVVAKRIDNGLIIDSIIVTDPTMPAGNKLVKVYSFSGAVEFLPGSRWITYGMNDDRKVYTHQSMTPQAPVQGSNIGFSLVSESTYGTDGYMGRSDVRFSNAIGYNNSYQVSYPVLENNYRWNGNHYFQPPYTNKTYLKEYKIGLKIHEKKYNKNNIALEETYYGYSFDEDTFKIAGVPVTNQNITYTGVTGLAQTILINGGVLDPLYTDTYKLIRGAARLSKMKKISYLGSIATADSFEYYYDSRGNMVSERSMIDGEDSRYDKQYYYPYNLIGQGNGTLDAKMSQLMDKNILGQIGYSNTKDVYGQVVQRLLVDAEFNDYGFDAQSDIYIKRTHKLIKGSTAWTGTAGDLAKSDGVQLLGGTALPAKYRVAIENQKTNKYFQVQESQLLGHNNFVTTIYDTAAKAAIATSNTRMDDFTYLGFEPNAERYRTTLNYSRIVELTTPPNSIPQAGTKMYQMLYNESLTITGFIGNKKYVVGCWVSTAGYPPPTLTVQTTNATVTLQQSANHKYHNWYYYQAEIISDIPSDFITIKNTTGDAAYIDELVIAPVGATYTLLSRDKYGNLETESGLNGKQIKYKYDGLFRPAYTTDENGNILKKFNYHISN